MLGRLLVASGAVLVLVAGCVTPEEEGDDGISVMQQVANAPDLPAMSLEPSSAERFRVVTYNIHSGLGRTRLPFARRAVVEANLRAIAAALAAVGPPGEPVDVVGLNEVDFDARRSGGIDEAAFVARELSARTGARYTVIPLVTWVLRRPFFDIHLGNALLTRHPVVSVDRAVLDGVRAGHEQLPSPMPDASMPRAEPRGAIRARLAAMGGQVDVVVTHLEAHYPRLREAQAIHVLRRFVDPTRRTVLLGDMNAVPEPLPAADRTDAILGSGELIDLVTLATVRSGTRDPGRWSTYPAGKPERAIDHVLATPDLLPVSLSLVDTDASDHLGLVATLSASSAAQRQALAGWRDALRRARLDRVLALAGARPVPPSVAGFLVHGTGLLGVAEPAVRDAILGVLGAARTAAVVERRDGLDGVTSDPRAYR